MADEALKERLPTKLCPTCEGDGEDSCCNLCDEIERALRVVRAATPGPWQRAHHGGHEVEDSGGVLLADCGSVAGAQEDADAIALLRNCGEELIDVLRAFAEARSEFTGRGVMEVHMDDWRRLMVSFSTAITRLRECLPNEESDRAAYEWDVLVYEESDT